MVSSTYPPDPEHVELLRAAIADPFIQEGESAKDAAILRWYKLAHENAPLWCFDAWAFQALREDDLPSAYPLFPIVGRISFDERAFTRTSTDTRAFWVEDPNEPSEATADDEPVPMNLATRRYLLADPERVHEAVTVRDSENGTPSIEGVWPSANWELAKLHRGVYQPDDGRDNPYQRVGERLVMMVEGVEWAKTVDDRRVWKAHLDRFLSSMGRTQPRGRPAMGAKDRVIEELFLQGKWLLSVCWDALPAEPSEATGALLDSLDIGTEEQRTWSTRLAVPMLSVVELTALLKEIPRPLGRQHRHIRPRRFVLHSLSHRLDTPQVTLARKLGPRTDLQYMKDHPNPITALRPKAEDPPGMGGGITPPKHIPLLFR